MALLKKVKSLLGLAEEEEPETSDDARDVGVTVEREPEVEPETGAEPGETAPETGSEVEEPDEGTDRAESVTAGEPAGSVVEEEPEPTEAAAPDVTDEAIEAAEPEREVESEPEVGSEPVVEIKGIGPSYADRLGEAGVDTVSDLADADADEVGEATGISPKRIEAWIERARDR